MIHVNAWQPVCAILHGKANTTAAVPIERPPLSTSFFLQSMDKWPEIEFPEIVNYLFLSSTNFSREQLKAFKSFRSYQYFVAGREVSLLLSFLRPKESTSVTQSDRSYLLCYYRVYDDASLVRVCKGSSCAFKLNLKLAKKV